jgi:dipeptidyl aminopeptidase/acylaminoacyl peptidase
VSNLYGDYSRYTSLPRVSGLAVSLEGDHVVTSVTSAHEGEWTTGIWTLDPLGVRPARALTADIPRQRQLGFLPDGRLLLIAPSDPSARDTSQAGLWLLDPSTSKVYFSGPAPTNILSLAVARETGAVHVLAESISPRTGLSPHDDATPVRAVLHDAHPIRFWDAELGLAETHLYVAAVPSQGAPHWRDITPTAGTALQGAQIDATPNGRTVVASWGVSEAAGLQRMTLVAIDTDSGERRLLADDGSSSWTNPQVSPDGHWVMCVRQSRATWKTPPERRLALVSMDRQVPPEDLAPTWDCWPIEHRWSVDGQHVFLTADDGGRRPLFSMEITTRNVSQISSGNGHYSDLLVGSDAPATLYALRSAIDAPPQPVRMDVATGAELPLAPDSSWVEAPNGLLQEVTTTASDGTSIRAWLALPPDTGPHPLVVWLHGGPLHSWAGWSWRANPWPLVARGYAVLMPDPALSTGYGRAFIQRGWDAWGEAPYDDVIRLLDQALTRPDLDAEKLAAVGGSFGGYLVNLIAGRTTRFRALVTHAGIWNLAEFVATSDMAAEWSQQLSPATRTDHSPSRDADNLRTPMLVIHGSRDYRVPIEQSLHLWWDLVSRTRDPTNMRHRFLHFPSENHFVLAPHNAALWLQSVVDFLDEHVRGMPNAESQASPQDRAGSEEARGMRKRFD